MIARLFATTVLTAVVAAAALPAAAQTRIAVGEETGATLNAQSPKLADGSYYACWVVEARGQPITIDLMSGLFDTFLVVGTGQDCGDSMTALAADDDSGNNTNSQISGTFDVPRLLIRANAFNAGEGGNYWIKITAGIVESEAALGSMDALPDVENEWGTDAYVCAGAYRAMGELRQYLTRYGNVGSIDYADRNRRVSSRLSAAEEGSADFMSSALALTALNGFIDELPQQVSSYLVTVADCDRANNFTPVTRFR